MENKSSKQVTKTGFVLCGADKKYIRSKNRYPKTESKYLQVICESGACENCQRHSGIPVLTLEGAIGENLPPFHPNCKCRVEPWEIDSWQAENFIWAKVDDESLNCEQRSQLLIDFYHITDFSIQSIRRVLFILRNPDIYGNTNESVLDQIKTFFFILGKAPQSLGKEMQLPKENVNFEMYRWEDYNGIKRDNPKIMQDMAYTDQDGFRRIHVPGLEEAAYMAALGSFYLKDEMGKVNPNGVVFQVYLSNGYSFYLVAGDMKADNDTNTDTHQYTYNVDYNIIESNTDIIEFIIDRAQMDSKMYENNFKEIPSYFHGGIIRMEKLPMTVLNK